MVDGPDTPDTERASREATTGTEPTLAEPAVAKRSHPEALRGDRYQVLDRLGKGGMGEVLVARDAQIGRDVALKRMLREAPDDKSIERFLREARVQGRLDHPSIVPVHELGRDAAGLPFF